jgi:hypothetical protein
MRKRARIGMRTGSGLVWLGFPMPTTLAAASGCPLRRFYATAAASGCRHP